MNDLSYLTDNIISRKWKMRYEQCSQEVRNKLDRLDDMYINEYQLQVIKRKKYIQRLEIFLEFVHMRI